MQARCLKEAINVLRNQTRRNKKMWWKKYGKRKTSPHTRLNHSPTPQEISGSMLPADLKRSILLHLSVKKDEKKEKEKKSKDRNKKGESAQGRTWAPPLTWEKNITLSSRADRWTDVCLLLLSSYKLKMTGGKVKATAAEKSCEMVIVTKQKWKFRGKLTPTLVRQNNPWQIRWK